MLEMKLLDGFIRTVLRYGRVELTDWSGYVRRYEGSQSSASEPWLRVKINDAAVVRNMRRSPSLAIGEGYMHGQLEISDLRLFFTLVARNASNWSPRLQLGRASNRRRAQRGNIAQHYDVGNEYYSLWLDPETWMYSCAYFREENFSLVEAQRAKTEHILKKLELQPGMSLLDIGCGWGHLGVEAAKVYGVKVLGITLSKEQLEGARQRAEAAGVSDLVTFELVNYQELKKRKELQGAFDRVVSVGMFEHVGKQDYDLFFQIAKWALAPEGVMVLHTITQRRSRPTDAFVDRYVFPGGWLPTVAEIEKAIASVGLHREYAEDLSQHYARTLELWEEAHAEHREEIEEIIRRRGEDGAAFYLMRQYWLTASQVAFSDGPLGLNQFTLTKGKLKTLRTRHGVYGR